MQKKRKKTEMHEYENFKKLNPKGSAREFYEIIRRFAVVLRTSSDSCTTQRGDVVTDVQSMLSLWREHFCGLLNGGEKGVI